HALSLTFISRFSLFPAAYLVFGILGLLVGLYPAIILSAFKPAASLKGEFFKGKSGGQGLVRRSLVVLQFSISIVVLVALFIVRQQLNYMNTKDVGFNKDNLAYISFVSWDGRGDVFKRAALQVPGVLKASITPWTPTSAGPMRRYVPDPANPDNKIHVWFITGDTDFAETFGLKLKEGRFLSSDFASDAMDDDSLMMLESAEYRRISAARSSLMTSYTSKVLKMDGLNQTIPEALT